MTDEKASNGNDGEKRFYFLDCSTYSKDEVVKYDPSTGYPVVHHNNDHMHRVISEEDIRFAEEDDASRQCRIRLYEVSDTYSLSPEELEQVLTNVGGLL
jgi:hypothetical protein